jgi:uncharacterized protein YbjT (DUF2867 family)
MSVLVIGATGFIGSRLIRRHDRVLEIINDVRREEGLPLAGG